MLINYFFIMFSSVFSGIVFIFLLKKFSLRFKILAPQGVPLIGGLGIWMSFVLSCLFGFFLCGGLFGPVFRAQGMSLQTGGILFASGVMLIFGIIDDWRELSIVAKLLVQLIAASVLIFCGIRTRIVNIGNLLNIIITFIWVLTITNAFNLLDVLDGLAGAVGIIVSIAFLAVSFFCGNLSTAILLLSLIGCLLGFLIYNFPPAKIYLGNSGSHFLGFILAAIAIAISYAPLERKFTLVSPILILGLPIFDTAFLILVRMNKKKPLFKKSNDHLALRLLVLGVTKRKALAAMLALCLFFSLCGVGTSRASNFWGIVIFAFASLVSLITVWRMSKFNG